MRTPSVVLTARVVIKSHLIYLWYSNDVCQMAHSVLNSLSSVSSDPVRLSASAKFNPFYQLLFFVNPVQVTLKCVNDLVSGIYYSN